MNPRTTIVGVLAGLAFFFAALQGSERGPMSLRDWALAIAGALTAVGLVFARDAGVPFVPPPPQLPPAPKPPAPGTEDRKSEPPA